MRPFFVLGCSIAGVEELGTMITFYNLPYYKDHLEKFGFTKQTDWVEENHAVQNLWNSFESRQHKRRRIYGKEID